MYLHAIDLHSHALRSSPGEVVLEGNSNPCSHYRISQQLYVPICLQQP